MTSTRMFLVCSLVCSILLGCASSAAPRQPQDLPSQAAYVTVKIVMTSEEGYSLGCASAVLIDVDRNPFTHDLLGVFLTARHAVQGAALIQVGFYLPGAMDASYVIDASPPLLHPLMDAALFIVPNLPEEFALAVPLAASDPVLGARVLSAGYAECGVLTMTVGYIFGQALWRNAPALLSTARAVPGMSGGPVLTEQGELIGITVAHASNNRSIHYLLPISALSSWLETR